MIPTEAGSRTQAPSSAPPRKQPDAVDVGWRLSDAIALVGVLYAIGLLAANIYLMQFGAADFSLLRPRAVVTGALIVLPAVIALWLPLFLFDRPQRRGQAGSWLGALNSRFTTGQAWVGEVSVQFLPFIYYIFAVASRPGAAQLESTGRWAEAFVIGFVLWATALGSSFFGVVLFAVLTGREESLYSVLGQPVRPREPTTPRSTAGIVTGLCFLAVVHVGLFVICVYPSVPRQMGGARQQSVRLVVDGAAATSLVGAGVPFPSLGPSTSLNATTTPVDLLEAGDGYLLIRLPSGEVVQIASPAVVGIVLTEN